MCGEPYKREEGIHGEGELEGLRMEARPITRGEDLYMGNVMSPIMGKEGGPIIIFKWVASPATMIIKSLNIQ